MSSPDYVVELLLKRCGDCGVEKPQSEFYRRALAADGLQYQCKICNRQWQRTYHRSPRRIAIREERRQVAKSHDGTSRQCTKCKVVKSRSQFNLAAYSADGLTSWCKDCFAERNAILSTPEFKEQTRIRDQSRKDAFRALVDEIKRSTPCKRCGGVFPPCVMDFHHREPAIKSFGIGTSGRAKLSRVKEEIAKCDLLCANCHRIVEFGDGKS